ATAQGPVHRGAAARRPGSRGRARPPAADQLGDRRGLGRGGPYLGRARRARAAGDHQPPGAGGAMTLAIVIILLFGLIALGVPLFIAIAASSAAYILLDGGWILSYPQQIIAGMNGFILLAMPLFILAGVLMNSGGISVRIFAFARALV